MEIIQDFATPSDRPHPLLVLLPGGYMRAQDFLTYGFFDAVRKIGRMPIDIIAADTGMEAYLDGSVVSRLHDEALAPILSKGARRVWLAGISLGGLGALLYAQAHPEQIEGLLLISPFIGTRGVVAEIRNAGGFRDWQPPTADAATDERRLLRWLKTYRSGDPAWPNLYLGYGSEDRFAASYRLLAEILPADSTVTTAGGHDWETWTVLWAQLLRKVDFRHDTAAAPIRRG